MALNIYCKECTKFTPEKGLPQPTGLPAGRCEQYQTDQMPDSFHLNCPGAARISEEPQGNLNLAPGQEQRAFAEPERPIEGTEVGPAEAKPFSGKKKNKKNG